MAGVSVDSVHNPSDDIISGDGTEALLVELDQRIRRQEKNEIGEINREDLIELVNVNELNKSVRLWFAFAALVG